MRCFFGRIIYEDVYVYILFFLYVASLYPIFVSAFKAHLNTLLTYVIFDFFPLTLSVHHRFFPVILCHNCPVMVGRPRKRWFCFLVSFVFGVVANPFIVFGFHLGKTVSFSFIGSWSLFDFFQWFFLLLPFSILVKRTKVKGFVSIRLVLNLLLFQVYFAEFGEEYFFVKFFITDVELTSQSAFVPFFQQKPISSCLIISNVIL